MTSSPTPSSSSSHSRGDLRKRDARRSGNMKCIITVGIILPILAAIIGIAAWAVNSDSFRRRTPTADSSFHHSRIRERFRNDYSPILEERNDDEILFGAKLPIGKTVSKDVLGSDTIQEEEEATLDLGDHSTQLPQLDPLYVVHYVPQPKSGVTSQTSSRIADPPPDVLSKILEASKGNSGKTPQFVVFAPMADNSVVDNERHDTAIKEERQPLPTLKRVRKLKKVTSRPVEEQHREEASFPDIPDRKIQVTPVPRAGFFDQQPHQPFSDFPQQWPNNNNQQQQFPQSFQPQYPKQSYQQPPPCCQQQHHQQQQHQQQSDYGQDSGNGVTITMGNGEVSPLGMLRQVLRPLMPNPQMDMKKKMFFGVQLENGFGFGGKNGASRSNQQTNNGGGRGGGGVNYSFG